MALPVTDLERSIGFYARFAAMQVVHRREGVVWLSDRTRPFVIVLIETPEVAAPLRPVAHLGVACASREEVDALCRSAKAEHALVSGPLDYGPPVGYWGFLRDPDGHTLEVSHGQEVGIAVAEAGPEGETRR